MQLENCFIRANLLKPTTHDPEEMRRRQFSGPVFGTRCGSGFNGARLIRRGRSASNPAAARARIH
ncbi:MAG: hypothetical protein K8F33_11395, partial [Thermomonas sp.]|uniref:hypothetical protein n=1 Tax=Thermomonas sp. TaxID=1971895 RepID=UPI001DA30AF4